MDDDVGVPVPEATIAEVEIVTPYSLAPILHGTQPRIETLTTAAHLC